jgi:serine/threonine protein kinase/WD40 repeat protein
MIGQKLQHYEIVAKIGEGGMGEVYRARDTQLGRDVAIKILPAAVAANPDRLRRFEQEARAAGALNHPSIVTVFELGTHEGSPYLVMELVEGETLRDKLAELRHDTEAVSTSGSQCAALPVRKVIAYGAQIARGLSAAHDKGVVHRDLKPENILITPDGQAKILDFGLAKLSDSAQATSTQTPTAAVGTAPGTVMGTVGYMAPEQVRGREVDQRADFFSLGAMLYEMLSGRRAFQGPSSVETLNAILTVDPPQLSGEHSSVSASIDRIVRRCLEKEPGERFHSGHDLALALEAVGAADSSPAMVATETQRERRPPKRSPWISGVAALALVALGAWIGSRWLQSTTAAPVSPGLRMQQLTFDEGWEFQPSIDAIGRSFVFVSAKDGDEDIYLQRVGGETAINLTADCDDPDLHPAFSPDGEHIAFRSERDGGGIFIMGATGESVRRLTGEGYHPAWSPDGSSIVYGTERIIDPTGRGNYSDLWKIGIHSGDRERLGSGDIAEPTWSPNGHRIAYWGLPEGTGQRVIYTMPADGGERSALVDDEFFNWHPRWSGDGRHLYYGSNRSGVMNLWRLAVDEYNGRPLGEPELLTFSTVWSGQHDVAGQTGDVIFSTRSTTYSIEFLPLDLPSKAVRSEPRTLVSGSRSMGLLRPSPDGRWIVFSASDPWEDLFVVTADGSGLRRLTNDRAKDRAPEWSGDSQTLYFFSDRGGRYQTWSIRLDGSGLTLVGSADDGFYVEPVPSPDGRWLVAMSDDWQAGLYDLEKGVPVSDVKALPLIDGESRFIAESWSPDGKHLVGSRVTKDAPISDVVAYSLEEEKYRLLAEKGQWAQWLPDSRHVVYAGLQSWMLHDTADGTTRPLDGIDTESYRSITPAPDGSGLYALRFRTRGDIWMLTAETP